jgi:hypothetical protein
MSLPMTKTLGQLREQVLLRCGYATTGNQSAAVAPLVNSFLIGSERELFDEVEWLNAQRRTTVTLTADVNTVDWPDDSEPGEIQGVWVVRADNGRISEVMPGLYLNERDDAENGESGRPILYEFMDQAITLEPAPSSDYTSLAITYRLAPSMVQENDTCLVDPEILIQRATFKFREYLGLPIGNVELGNHERYLARLRSSNAQKGGLVLGGHKSWRTDTHKRNRVARDSSIGSGSAYTSEWSPF